jgi:tRNA threonylcarbamoyl adenosine modification protein YjeE
VKCLADALGSCDPVTSPTFNITNIYNIKKGKLIHIDVYRLSKLSEYRNLSVQEFKEQSITIIEWGDTVCNEFEDYLEINFNFMSSDENHRCLQFSFIGDRWANDILTIDKELSGFNK